MPTRRAVLAGTVASTAIVLLEPSGQGGGVRPCLALVGAPAAVAGGTDAGMLLAESEPALLDLCAVPLAAGGPHAALLRGQADPSQDRFTLLALGREPPRPCRIRATRAGGRIFAASSSVIPEPRLSGTMAVRLAQAGIPRTLPVLAPAHLRSALTAGHLAGAVLTEDEALPLVMQGVACDLEVLPGAAGLPPRVAIDRRWAERHPAAAERLVAFAAAAARLPT